MVQLSHPYMTTGKTIGLTAAAAAKSLQSCLTICDPMSGSMPDFPIFHYHPEFAQTHVHWVSDVIQPSHPLSSPSPPALILSWHQGLFQWVGSLHQVAKVLEFQLQDQSFQCLICVYHITRATQAYSGKESTCQAGDAGSILGSERSPGEGNGNLLQYLASSSLTRAKTIR